MADRDLEVDMEAIFKDNPLETRMIIGSIVGYFMIFEVIGADWLWHQAMECGFWNGEYCGGTEWWLMLHMAILTMVFTPAIWGGMSILTKKYTHVEKARRDEVVGVALFGLGSGGIWAVLFSWSLPHTWFMMPFEQGGWGWIFMWIFLLLPMGFSVIIGTLIWISSNLKEFASVEEDVKKVETDFKAKLASSTDEGNKFEIKKEKSLDPTKQPLTKEQEFTSILGDMGIHEKYKK
jgi:hypothetical protein